MALDKDALQSKLEKLFDVAQVIEGETTKKIPAAQDTTGDGVLDLSSAADFANLVADYIDEYLVDVETGDYAGVGIDPVGNESTTPPSPKPDPDGAPDSPVTPNATLTVATFRTKLIERCEAHAAGADKDFSECKDAFEFDMTAFTTNTDGDRYTGVGVTLCPAGPDLDAAFDTGEPGGGSSADVAAAVATAIDDATTGTTHTIGAYANSTFVLTGGGGNLK